jgi:hypothetical protein
MRRNSTFSVAIVFVLVLNVLVGSLPAAEAWILAPSSPSPRVMTTQRRIPSQIYENKNDDSGGDGEEQNKKGLLDMLSPYDSKIPPELRDEIYAAEANTPAAKERGQRVALYVLIAFVGVMSAFFNGFLTELRGNGPDAEGSIDLVTAGFGWVVGNPVFSFLYLNKIGGAICLLGGGGAGLLAEAELDTKRINAEKIYEELERRRQAKTKTKKKSGPASSSSSSRKNKRRGGKETKRLEALSEVISLNESSSAEEVVQHEVVDEEPASASTTLEEAKTDDDEASEKSGEGILGSIKSFYDKADSMAASQALLINKKLEDAGVVEKITDESGLKVIGRDEAAKLKEETDKADQNK